MLKAFGILVEMQCALSKYLGSIFNSCSLKQLLPKTSPRRQQVSLFLCHVTSTIKEAWIEYLASDIRPNAFMTIIDT